MSGDEKLRERLRAQFREHYPDYTIAELTKIEGIVRAELERAEKIAEKEKANIKDIDVAPEIQMVVNVACDQIATAIRKLKE